MFLYFSIAIPNLFFPPGIPIFENFYIIVAANDQRLNINYRYHVEQNKFFKLNREESKEARKLCYEDCRG